MTLNEIASLAGVSKTTASYVINGKAKKYRISEKTQQKVMAIVEEYNYQPDHAASSLRAGHSRSFGLIIPDLENASYAKLAKLLEQRSREAGYQILIGCSDDQPDIEVSLATALLSRRIDALFVATCLPQADEHYLKIQKSGTPVVAIDRPLDAQYFGCVVSEDYTSAFDLTESVLTSNFLTSGIKTVGLIGALSELGVSKNRQLGFEAAASAHKINTIVGYGQHFSKEEGKAIFEQWINDKIVPDAIVVTSYILLEGVLDVLLDHPMLMSTIKLGTFGDNRLLDFLPIKVNSLPQQFELIAERAIAIALKRQPSDIDLIPRKLVCR